MYKVIVPIGIDCYIYLCRNVTRDALGILILDHARLTMLGAPGEDLGELLIYNPVNVLVCKSEEPA